MSRRTVIASALALAVVVLAGPLACSKKDQDLVTLGDPAAGATDTLTVGQLLMNLAGAMDKPVKLKADLGQKGNTSDGYISLTVVSASGPFEIRVAEKYRDGVDKLKPNDRFIAIGQLAAAGSEVNPRMVFQVD
ncbi:MAG: hypothetical protein U0610_22540 [bacterium]